MKCDACLTHLWGMDREYLVSGKLEAADAISDILQPCEPVPVLDQIPCATSDLC